jgi:TonB family protein
MTTETLPRPLGKYLLTAALGEDALGHEYRALRAGEGVSFVRFRALDAPELSEDAVLDAIEENGEVHEFLKNPAVARGVDMDAADGVPYIAWNEPNGRTLKNLLLKCRNPPRKIPVEHALLISEKIATALDHAYNTSIDGDRTLHGLVWPGFVALSDDGEIRLAGFGLAGGVLPSIVRPRLTREIANYLAPEEKNEQAIGKNSDVYSVGVILLELLTGQPPGSDPLGVLRGTAGNPPPPILPEIQAVLKMTLGPPETRYGSSGDLRRELGKLLFSGPYSPSTFNLAYFVNDLFRDEIEAETRARNRESAPATPRGRAASALPSRPAAAPPRPPAPSAPASQPTPPAPLPPPAARRRVWPWIAAGVAAAAIGGGLLVLRREGNTPVLRAAPRRRPPPPPTPTFLPEFLETPTGPTNAMSDAQFQEEVSRRLAQEVQKLEAQLRARPTAAPAAAANPPSSPPLPRRATAQLAELLPSPLPTLPPLAEPTSAPTAAPAAPSPTERAAPAPTPAPTRPAVREGTLIPLEEADSPPRIARIVKPSYPPLALRTRIGGIVVLRVLVSERGAPLEIEVLRGAPAGLTEAAVEAVQKWTFDPARKSGLAMQTWMVIPIPFEP